MADARHPDTLLPDLSDFVTALVEPAMTTDGPFYVDEVTLDMPMELQVVPDGVGGVHLQASPPTQTVATSILPVWHRLRVTIGGRRDE